MVCPWPPAPRYPFRGGFSCGGNCTRQSTMGRTGVIAAASPSRSTILRSSGNVDKTDVEGWTPPRQRLGRCGIIARPVSVEQALHTLLRVTMWCLFAERLLQPTAVGWGQSRRVGPLEQVRQQFTSRGVTLFFLAVGAIGGTLNPG